MKHLNTIQQCLWFGFLLYYAAAKYLAGGVDYSHAYAFQVAIIVTLTAIIPFYLASRLGSVVPKGKIAILLIAPTMLSVGGYAAFFLVFIAPNFPDVPMAGVVSRGVIPGALMSALLVFPVVLERLNRDAEVIAT